MQKNAILTSTQFAKLSYYDVFTIWKQPIESTHSVETGVARNSAIIQNKFRK